MKIPAILIFSFLIINVINAQEKYLDIFPLKNGKVTYSAVIETKGIFKDELSKRAKRWLANNCELIKLDDENIVVGRGVFTTIYSSLYPEQFYVWHTITIQFKDGRYKYEISDIRFKFLSVSGGNSLLIDEPIEDPNRMKEKQIKKIDPQVNELISSLDQAMKTPIDDNW